MLRAGIVASVLGVLGGFLGVWLGIAAFEDADQNATNLHAIVHDELHLSARQEEAIEGLEAEFALIRERYEAEMEDARQEIGAALLRDQALSADVAQAAKAFHTAMGGLQMETLNHILAMRAELDPDQVQEFDLRLAQAFHADTE